MDSKATNAGRKRLEGNRRGDDAPNRLHTSSKQFLKEARLQEFKHNGFEFIWGPCFLWCIFRSSSSHPYNELSISSDAYINKNILHVSVVSTAHEKYYIIICLSPIHLSIHLYIYPSIIIHLPMYIYPSTHLSVCLSIINLFIWRSIDPLWNILPVNQAIHLSWSICHMCIQETRLPTHLLPHAYSPRCLTCYPEYQPT